MNDPQTTALLAVRTRSAALADAIIHAEIAQAKLAIALDAARAAGCDQAQVDTQIGLATADKPERARALERLRLLES